MKNNQNNKENLVSDLYSRQVGLYGLETMKKIMKLNILIYGMRGLGIEIAKNIILSGPNRVTIFDPNIAKINDLTANFYLTKDDIENQKRRYEAVLNKIALFYPYVEVNIMKGKNILENINHSLENEKSKYDVVVISEFLSPDEIIKINDICRNNQIGFIYTSQLGIYGFCFVDFGDNFTVIDENGSEPLKYCIKSITKDKIGVVTIDTTAGILKLGDNDKVTFDEIEGMTELKKCEHITIKVLTNNSLKIGDT
jgi:ubiquitin-activating enzyme E1